LFYRYNGAGKSGYARNNFFRQRRKDMGLLNINNVESLLKKINDTKKIFPEHSKPIDHVANNLYVYQISVDSVHQNDLRHIAFTSLDDDNGRIYVNKLSKLKVSYFDFFDSDAWVEEEYSKDSNIQSLNQSALSVITRFSSLNPKNNNILKLRLKTLEDFRILLLWYVGYSYTQDEIRKMLLANNYHFTDSPFDFSSSKAIGDKLLDKRSLSLFLKTTFAINEKPYYHRKTIKKIIGDQQEKYFFDSEKSSYFKVLSLFSLLSKGKKIWHHLISDDTKVPSLSNNPATLEYKGFKDEESINTGDEKLINDAILRCFYSQLIQAALTKNPLLNDLIMPKHNCLSNLDLLLGEFDIYLQKLFDWHMLTKPGYVDGQELESGAIKEAFLETRQHVDAVLKRCESKVNSKDDLILTLIKCASINRANNDYNFILNLYAKMDEEIPDGIDLMKNVRNLKDIKDVLIKIFNIEESEIPEDLIECAMRVIEMHSLFYDLEASPEQLRQFKRKSLSLEHIGASAAQILNGYIKSKETGKRLDFKIRIRGETNPGINVYNELSNLTQNMLSDDKDLRAFYMYSVPDDFFKYLTVRYSIIYSGMKSRSSIKNGALAQLQLKIKKIELQQEVIELFRGYSIQHICLFLNLFKKYVIVFVNANQHEIVNFEGMKVCLPYINDHKIHAINKWLERD
jgi:hypothetical protein